MASHTVSCQQQAPVQNPSCVSNHCSIGELRSSRCIKQSRKPLRCNVTVHDQPPCQQPSCRNLSPGALVRFLHFSIPGSELARTGFGATMHLSLPLRGVCSFQCCSKLSALCESSCYLGICQLTIPQPGPPSRVQATF